MYEVLYLSIYNVHCIDVMQVKPSVCVCTCLHILCYLKLIYTFTPVAWVLCSMSTLVNYVTFVVCRLSLLESNKYCRRAMS